MTSIFPRRLREAMERENMKQADLVEKTGINKAAISSYLSGKYEPKQKNIYLLANVLNVEPGWLIGLDDEEDVSSNDPYYLNEDTAQLAQEIYDNKDLGILLDAGRKLSPDDLKAVIAIVERMKGNE